MTTTVGALIERSRMHNVAFTPEKLTNRVALSFLSTRHQELLRLLSEDLVDRLSESRAVADEIDNDLVGVDSDGNAYSVAASGDGYDVVKEQGDAVDITSSSAASPTNILAPSHGLQTGDSITIAGHDGSDDDDAVNASHQVTYVDADNFTIPVDLSGGAGTGGTVKHNRCYYQGPTAIAQDPYTDGFPIPVDAIKIVNFYAKLSDSGRYRPIVVVPQRDIAIRHGSGNNLYAIINAQRLVPIQNAPANTGGSRWDTVEEVTITFVDLPARFEEVGAWEDQLFTVPDLYVNALEYELAAHFGSMVPDFDVTYLKAQADERMSIAMGAAKREERSLKFRQVRRNR